MNNVAQLTALVAKMQADFDAGRRTNPAPTVEQLLAAQENDRKPAPKRKPMTAAERKLARDSGKEDKGCWS